MAKRTKSRTEYKNEVKNTTDVAKYMERPKFKSIKEIYGVDYDS